MGITANQDISHMDTVDNIHNISIKLKYMAISIGCIDPGVLNEETQYGYSIILDDIIHELLKVSERIRNG